MAEVCFFFAFLLFFSVFHSYRCSVTSTQEDANRCTASVLETDEILRQLAANYVDGEFIHPKANRTVGGPQGPKMNSVREIATVCEELAIDIERPCGGRAGANLTMVVFVYVRVADFDRRQTIRQTFGSVLSSNPRTVLYFVLARVNDTR